MPSTLRPLAHKTIGEYRSVCQEGQYPRRSHYQL